MSDHRLHRAAVLLAGAVAASAGGCFFPNLPKPENPPFEMKEQLVIMPDGSGKMTFTVVMLGERPTPKQELAAELADRLETPRYPSAFYRALFQGAVAFSPIRGEAVTDGCANLSYTVYFQNVNGFRFRGSWLNHDVELLFGEERYLPSHLKRAAKTPWTSFRFAKSGDGFALDQGRPVKGQVVKGQVVDEFDRSDLSELALIIHAWMFRYLGPRPGSDWRARMGPWKAIAEAPIEGDDPDGSKAARKAFAERVLEGRRYQQVCVMPGEITKAPGRTSHEGRTATFTFTRKEINARMQRLDEDLRGQDEDAQAKIGKVWFAEMLEEYLGRRIECGPKSVPEETVAAFREELEQAKAEWDLIEAKRRADEAKQRADEAKRRLEAAKRLLDEAEGRVRWARSNTSRDPVAAEKGLQDAKRLRETAVRKDPEGVLAGEVEKLDKDIEEVSGILAEYKDERRASGLLQSARLLLEGGKLEAATERLERILREHPKRKVAPTAREVLDLLKKGKIEDAKRRLQ